MRKRGATLMRTQDLWVNTHTPQYKNSFCFVWIFLVHDRAKAISVEEFSEYVQRKHADRDKWFEMEYNVSSCTRTHACWNVALSSFWCAVVEWVNWLSLDKTCQWKFVSKYMCGFMKTMMLCCLSALLHNYGVLQDIDRNPQFDYEVAKIPENRARNRFGNIFPCTYKKEKSVHSCYKSRIVYKSRMSYKWSEGLYTHSTTYLLWPHMQTITWCATNFL